MLPGQERGDGSLGMSRRSPSLTSRLARAEGCEGSKLNYAFHYGMFRFYRKFEAPRRSLATNLIVYAGIGAKFAFSVARTTVRRLLSGGLTCML